MNQSKRYFVTGIDTDSGKTVISAILTQKLKADYWKPVQAGQPTDSDSIRTLISPDLTIHPEGALLNLPMSPHAAAKAENIYLTRAQFAVPHSDRTMVIEGAGGIMVPINDQDLVIDLAMDFDAEVILVSRNYLGSINHTLLSIAYLRSRNFKIAGIIFNDETNTESERFILNYSQLPCLGRIPRLDQITPQLIDQLGDHITLP
ncbi:dethiobiotin synthase [Reichenbachiella agarivorans]|uniref:ATP-dependent dethiobiotin synthetase BioD n=1 Tax=Reichenbachiella agarivorans TaxID=2979464 RepID=A0ABY6CP81_9BACT|nr:dethiobiotin synthase [Reichenbachiella agarivorans]UXP32336.1 dethiobiotin synthase [Reichenbachiella agarivorans]